MSSLAKPRIRMRAGEYANYETASNFLQMATWCAAGGDADAVEVERPELVARCWDLYRNNPLATGAVDTVVDNVVGTGLRMQSRLDADRLGITQEQADAWERDVEARFEAWAMQPRECDLEGRLTFAEHQRLAVTSALCAGDALLSLPMTPRAGTLNQTRIQAIDADRLVNPDGTADTRRITGGIEVDLLGEPSAYHVLYAHPESHKLDAPKLRWMRIPARGRVYGRKNVVHLFRAKRPGQRRGVPFLAPVGAKLKQLDRYTDAELVAAVVGGMFAVFIETEDGGGLGHGEGSSVADSVSNNPALQRDSVTALNPGMIAELGPGEKVQFASPNRPSGNFGPFFESLSVAIGAGTGIPLEILIKHFRKSYSASRAARLEANRMFMGRRGWVASGMCQPIYETWLLEQVAEQRIQAPGFLADPERRALWCRADWIGPSWGQLDPVKETMAELMAYELTATSLSDICQRLYGQNHEVVVHRIARERRFLVANDVPIPSRGNIEQKHLGQLLEPAPGDDADEDDDAGDDD